MSPSRTAASFVRPTRRSDPERTFLQAVRDKYSYEEALQSEPLAIDQQIEISGKIIEEVGFDKIREQQARLHDLKVVIVDGMQIKTSEDSIDIKATCPNIVELDLSRNLFEDFDDIALIVAFLEDLRVLKLK